MDKNIAALLREDSRTVEVAFSEGASGTRTYVTDLQLSVGDKVVVDARGALKVATVAKVHDGLEITPNSDVKYKWVVSVVDMQRHLDSEHRNEQIEAAIAAKYRETAQRQFRETVMEGLPSEVTLLLGGAK